MTDTKKTIEEKSINTLRLLAVDAIQKAKSGHPGMPMGCAPIAYLLYRKVMKHNPLNSKWLNRDRFILSGGHGSMLLYGILHLSGYKISMDDIKSFRQWQSITPGHPEFGLTDGVETTTGPLGQGFANAVGMAVAQNHLAAMFNKDNFKILDHYIYVEAGDGDLMEGISHEAASFAGHNKLGKLIVFYDNNSITIDGSTSLANSDDVKKRFEAYNWQVLEVNDGNNLDELETAVKQAQQETEKPSIIITTTVIGFGSPNLHGTSKVHGSPLGDEEIILTKENFGFPSDKSFYVPDDVYEHFEVLKEKGKSYEDEWNKMFDEYAKEHPKDAKLFKEIMNGNFGEDWKTKLPKFENYGDEMATRKASGTVLNEIAAELPMLIGGSADLTPSNNTQLKGYHDYTPTTQFGRYIRYGIREFAMAAIMNGMAIYGGTIPYGGTFMVFSDYLRGALRLAAISKVKPIFVFTHDSIGVGEDGPTHQPVEHLAALRSIPGLVLLRPADANETTEAWKFAIEHKGGPVALALTRQNLKIIDRNKFTSAEELHKGAYVLKDTEGTPDIILMASGSEVNLILEAAGKLNDEGIKTRVVSFPSWEVFEMQADEYKESVLPSNVKARVAVEAGVSQGWHKYVGLNGEIIAVDKYGASAPQKTVFEKYGFTVENILVKAKKVLS